MHVARLATLKIEQDLEFASILLSAAVNILAICMSCRSANLKIAVSMCKSILSTPLRYTVIMVDGILSILSRLAFSSMETDRQIKVINGAKVCIILNRLCFYLTAQTTNKTSFIFDSQWNWSGQIN